MASSYSDLGLELMATGENAGTWGTKTNANLSLVEQLTGGYLSLAVAGSGTTALTIADGALTGTAQHRVIELTGALTGSRILTLPLLTENFYFIKNTTTNAETLQIKAVSGSGATVTWATTDKGWKIIYVDGVATNTGVYEVPMTSVNDVTLTGTQTLTNKTLTAPKIADAGFIADANGLEQIIFQTTSSAVNELEVTNAATGNGPILGASGETNVDLNITPKGTGRVVLGAGAIQNLTEKATISATAATGTINYDVRTQAVLYYTTAASGNFTVNFRGDGSTTLNNIMDTGESVTVAFLVTNTGSAYYNNAVTIDGSSKTPEWQGGGAPSAGNANSIDVYTYTIFKTGNAAFTVLAAQTQFA